MAPTEPRPAGRLRAWMLEGLGDMGGGMPNRTGTAIPPTGGGGGGGSCA